jgi:hypothetical protein
MTVASAIITRAEGGNEGGGLTSALGSHKLVTVIKGNMSVDWMHRDSATRLAGRCGPECIAAGGGLIG